MFITRKQLEEEKAKAVREFEEKQWLRERDLIGLKKDCINKKND